MWYSILYLGGQMTESGATARTSQLYTRPRVGGMAGAESLISLKGAFGIRAGSIPKTWKLIHNWFFTVNNWFHIMTPKPKTAKENQFLIPRSRSRPSSRTFVLLSLSLTLPNTNAQLCHHHWVWEAFMILCRRSLGSRSNLIKKQRQT